MSALLVSVLLLAPAPQAKPEFTVGVQAYSFNRFTAFEAIEMTARAGASAIELYPGQRVKEGSDVRVGPGMGKAAEEELKEHLAKHGVSVRAFGVTGIPRDEAAARPIFEWAQRMGISILNTESDDAIDTIEKFVKEYDVYVGFHNHPSAPNNPSYKVWNPRYIAQLVKDRDRRIGACADTGHWVRSGIKPMDALRILRGRVVSAHLKDLNVFARDGYDVPWGTGVSEMRQVLIELRRQGFRGHASVEYERNWDHSLPEVAQCIGFARGVLAD
jgi:sugar phosphate isomerase/epimerase